MMRPRQKAAVALAAALLVAGPSVAYLAAPAAATNRLAAPGSGLAGINADATGAATQVELLVPGLLPLGNAAQGDLVNVSVPFANSTAGTGPTTAGIAAPAWPGTAIASAGSLVETFSASFPAALANLLNDHAAAYSTYPAQFNVKQSGKFSAPAGVGTSTTSSTPGRTVSHAVLSDTVPLGRSSPLAAVTKLLPLAASKTGPLIEVASATTSSSATVNAASVATTARTNIGTVTIAGLIKINGIASDASTRSDGTIGHDSGHLHVGAVTVAGIPASIGPSGISLKGKSVGSLDLIHLANTVLTALNQAGITIRTVSPATTVKGSSASATSGAVQIAFQDDNIPNLAGLFPQLPLLLPNTLGVRVNLGLSQADANATLLASTGTVGGTVPPSSSSTLPPSNQLPGGPTGSVGVGSGLPPVSTSSSPPPGSTPVVAQPITDKAFGVPVRVAWVVAAFLLSLLAAGPLLAYANWQLLRGRTP